MRSLPDIQAVTLDVGGTLIRPWPSVGHIYSEVAAHHGHPIIPPETLNLRFAAAWRAKQDFPSHLDRFLVMPLPCWRRLPVPSSTWGTVWQKTLRGPGPPACKRCF